MSDGARGKKRSKSYYKKCAAGAKRQKRGGDLGAGMRGFLVMCNMYEKEAVREIYNILNEYADELYGPEMKTAGAGGQESASDSSDDDMEAAMARETASIKNVSKTDRRFQQVDTKTKNILFIRTTVADPCQLAHRVFTDLVEKKVQKARYALRLLPITVTCKANVHAIEEAAKELFKPHFETEFGVGVKYTSVCKFRNSQSSVNRTSVLPSLGRIIREMNPLHQLCHDEPDLVVLVEVVRNICCLSVVKDFFTFKKYNLHEVVKQSEGSHSKVAADSVGRESDKLCTVPPHVKHSEETHSNVTKQDVVARESDKQCAVPPQDNNGNKEVRKVDLEPTNHLVASRDTNEAECPNQATNDNKPANESLETNTDENNSKCIPDAKVNDQVQPPPTD